MWLLTDFWTRKKGRTATVHRPNTDTISHISSEVASALAHFHAFVFLPALLWSGTHSWSKLAGLEVERERHVVVCFNISTSASLYGKRAWEERSEFMISLAIARCISLPQPMGRFRAKPDTLVGTREQFMWPFYFVRSSNRFRSPKTSCNTWSSGRKKLEWSEHKND